VLAIELDDSSHDREDRKDRDAFVDQVFAAARKPILHVRARGTYQTDEILELLEPHIGVSKARSKGLVNVAVAMPDDSRYMPRADHVEPART